MRVVYSADSPTVAGEHPADVPREIVDRYLDALGLTGAPRAALWARIHVRAGPEADARALFAAMHSALADSDADPDNPASTSVSARMALAADAEADRDTRPSRPPSPLVAAPPLARTPMAPSHWMSGWLDRFRRRGTDAAEPELPPPHHRWRRTGLYRRTVLAALILGQLFVATQMMAGVLPYHGRGALEMPVLVLFVILFGWLSASFWTAMAGYLVLCRGGDRWAISRTAGNQPIPRDARTAVIMPIANEDVVAVFARLRAVYESVARTGELERFDFFVLSDSASPDTRVAEVTAWFDLCRATGDFGRIFYRWRTHRIKRKNGNVADFCRRWGRRYRYMLVVDADSLMTGECITRLVRIAEANPDAGILQTAPRASGRDTLSARVQQFAMAVYGPLFTAGLHYWQLGESHYWGHNALIRVDPFIRHCALGRLSGTGSLSGEILSHDFVEAALMRRAGWKVWIVFDLPGSYEEMPPNLIDELKRDQRWCQGNLMNLRLTLMKGLHPAHRVVFMTGVMAYVSAALWFLFLVFSTALLAVHALTIPQYFIDANQLVPRWPAWRPDWALCLFGATACLLFGPKLLAAGLLSGDAAKGFGGRRALWSSVLLEMLLSALLAPIRMLFHTRFVVLALTGLRIGWNSPARSDAETTWQDALRYHGLHTAIGVAWLAFVTWLSPASVGWILPVAGALLLSIPLSVLTSRVSLGRRARRAGLFVIPEENCPPRECRATRRYRNAGAVLPTFADAALDPRVNAIVCGVGNSRRRLPAAAWRRLVALARRMAQRGPDSLTADQKSRLLNDPLALSSAHSFLWIAGRAASAGNPPRRWLGSLRRHFSGGKR